MPNENLSAFVEPMDDMGIDFEAMMQLPQAQPMTDGIHQTKDDSGLVTEITYLNGKKNGLMRMIQDDLLTMDMMFQDNILHGPMHFYYPSGKIHIKMLFENGLQHGQTVHYHQNGIISMIMPFDKGKKNGLCQAINNENVLIQESFYVDDTLDGAVNTYFNGNLIARAFYSKGIEIKDKQE